MARRPFFCGRCGKRFSLASKYCPSCGAILSLPVGSRGADRSAEVPYANSWGGSRSSALPEILFAMALLIGLFLVMRAATANGADKRIRVVTTEKYVDVIDHQPYKLKKITRFVAEEDIEKYPEQKVILGLRPEHEALYPDLSLDEIAERVADGRISVQIPAQADKESESDVSSGSSLDDSGVELKVAPMIVLASSPDLDRSIAVRIGMTPQQVKQVWGEPKNTELHPRNGRVYEMWRFGDPKLDVETGARYVEFGPDNRVVTVRDGDVIVRKRVPDPPDKNHSE